MLGYGAENKRQVMSSNTGFGIHRISQSGRDKAAEGEE